MASSRVDYNSDAPRRSLNNQTTLIMVGVAVLHAFGLWGLQQKPLQRPQRSLVTAQLITEIATEAPRNTANRAQRLAPKNLKSSEREVRLQSPTQNAAAMPVHGSLTEAPPPPSASNGAVQPPLPPAVSTPAPSAVLEAFALRPTAGAAPARVELPSTDADHLQNPKPVYPRLSKKLAEQGTVIMRVLIGVNGEPLKAELALSSGFARLDESAAATVMQWRYLPGTRDGAPTAMWFNVPIRYVLE